MGTLMAAGLASLYNPFEEAPAYVPDDGLYVPSNERVGVPGVPYAYASVFYSAPIYVSEVGDEDPDYRLRDPLNEGYGLRLYPAHLADMKVALWHQLAIPGRVINSSFQVEETFVFYDDSDKVVGWFHADYLNKLVWSEVSGFVRLDFQACWRLRQINRELKAEKK